MQEFLRGLSGAFSDNFFLAAGIALLLGMLTVFTPCSLTNIPLIVSYLGGATKKRAALLSAFICAGQSAVFVVMGLLAAALGKLMNLAGFDKLWHSLLAAVMLFMALEMFGVTKVLHKHSHSINAVQRKGVLGALLIGMLGALFATPCSMPVLSAILAYVSAARLELYFGGIMMLAYGLGHSIPLVIAGSSISFVQKMTDSKRYAKVSKIIKSVMGVLLIALAVYLIVSAFWLE